MKSASSFSVHLTHSADEQVGKLVTQLVSSTQLKAVWSTRTCVRTLVCACNRPGPMTAKTSAVVLGWQGNPVMWNRRGRRKRNTGSADCGHFELRGPATPLAKVSNYQMHIWDVWNNGLQTARLRHSFAWIHGSKKEKPDVSATGLSLPLAKCRKV